jgi:hypothetical protein
MMDAIMQFVTIVRSAWHPCSITSIPCPCPLNEVVPRQLI